MPRANRPPRVAARRTLGLGASLARAEARLLDWAVASSALPTIAVLASGRGGNFEALATASLRGEIPGRVTVLLCDRPDAPVVARARALGIEVLSPPVGTLRTRIEDETRWTDALHERGVSLVLLAGFMRRLHDPFLEAFPDRILNVHPSLLPAFPGLDAIRRAFEHGVRVTGCTVHLVDRGLDEGPIVAQRAVPVGEGETLAELEQRIHEAEHLLYPEAVRRFLSGSWTREGRRLVFRPGELHHA